MLLGLVVKHDGGIIVSLLATGLETGNQGTHLDGRALDLATIMQFVLDGQSR
jgi:hypothetical protein